MSIAIVGLGPMGGAVGHHLHDLGHDVVGLDLDTARAVEWAAPGRQAFTSAAALPWTDVDTVIIAVRLIEHIRASVDSIAPLLSGRPVTVIVITTLAVSDAREYLPALCAEWRVFEFPVSGGPEGARTGTLSAMLAGPEPTAAERGVLGGIASWIFPTSAYGEPAALKLLNNTMGAYVALATGRMAQVAESLDVPAATFLAVARASSGQSWMADHFEVFHHPLLIKDVRLLLEDVTSLPVVDLNEPDQLDDVVRDIRERLGQEVEK